MTTPASVNDTTAASARVRDMLPHPVVDADGHWLEPVPVFEDFLQAVGGGAAVDAFRAWRLADTWYGLTPEQRLARRTLRPGYWGLRNDPGDWATKLLPELLAERLPEFGIDVSFVYPTLGLFGVGIADAGQRREFCRAFNEMTAELFASHRARLIPVAVVPTHSPDEALDELDHAVAGLGFRAVMISGTVRRRRGEGADPLADPADRPSYVDVLAMDSPFDYEPLWRRFEDLGVAVTTHGGSLGWDGRQSPSNYTFNHIGHFAQANHAFARGLILSGLPVRHPSLRFVFLEGGAGWAANLLVDLVAHWHKRRREVMEVEFRPDRVDAEALRDLLRRHGRSSLGVHLDEMCRDDMLDPLTPHRTLAELTARESAPFDFDRLPVDSEAELRALFSEALFFGVEGDDPMTKVAFDETLLRTRLRPVLGSDISHFDVVRLTDVLAEAHELVEDGLLTEDQFRELTFTNAVDAHTHGRPDMFAGTAVEAAVAEHLAGRARAAGG